MEREKTHQPKLKFYNADRKMKNIITLCIFTSVIMHPNFMHFRLKNSFKSFKALENFASLNGHSRIALSIENIINYIRSP